MRKVVKSRADLNAVALRNGATITDQSGQRFNVAGTKSKAIKKAQTKKEIKHTEIIKEPVIVASMPDNSMLIADAVERQTLEFKAALESLKEQMTMIKLDHPEPITAWDFKVTKNNDGSLDIKARVPDIAISRVIN